MTSNRDESPIRTTIPPKKYDENGVELTFPKDELAGGTWIGLSEKNRLVCLLNGGFTKHERNKYYRLSRGVIVKEILISNDAVAFITDYDFVDIEPFTIVLVDWNTSLQTFELVWDGTQKHFKQLTQEPHIWSSSTLYTEEMKQSRKNWFADWLSEQVDFQQANILEFHQDETKGDVGTSLKMKRPFVETVSVTSVIKENYLVKMTYKDLLV
nr:NRDE family protein [Tenacibaculum todarodis]